MGVALDPEVPALWPVRNPDGRALESRGDFVCLMRMDPEMFFGIKGQAFQWLNSFFSKRSKLVALNACRSTSVALTTGIPQGSVVGP